MISFSRSLIVLSLLVSLTFAGNLMQYVFTKPRGPDLVRRIFKEKSGTYMCITEPGSNLTLLVNGKDTRSYFLKHDSDEALVLVNDFDASQTKAEDYLKPYLNGVKKTVLNDAYEKAKKSIYGSKFETNDPKRQKSFIKGFKSIVSKITIDRSKRLGDFKGFLAKIDNEFALVSPYFKYIYTRLPPFNNDRYLDEYYQYQDYMISLMRSTYTEEKISRYFHKPLYMNFTMIYLRPFLPTGIFALASELSIDLQGKTDHTPVGDVYEFAKKIAIRQKKCRA